MIFILWLATTAALGLFAALGWIAWWAIWIPTAVFGLFVLALVLWSAAIYWEHKRSHRR